MRYLLLPFTRRYVSYAGALVATILLPPLSYNHPVYWVPFGLAAMLAALGTRDLLQTRNYPIVGHIRFLLEEIRPEVRQLLCRERYRWSAVQPERAHVGL